MTYSKKQESTPSGASSDASRETSRQQPRSGSTFSPEQEAFMEKERALLQAEAEKALATLRRKPSQK